MKSYALKTDENSPVLAKNKGKFLAIQGDSLWFQDEPKGWALFACEKQAKQYRKAYGGEILEIF